MMRLYKSSFKDKTTGQTRSTPKWYIEFRDHYDRVRRMPAFAAKAPSEELGRKIDQLVAGRISGTPHDVSLSRWIESLSPQILTKLIELDVLDPRLASVAKTLEEHLEDFQRSLLSKNNTASYVRLVVFRVRRVLDGCSFRYWSDISASAVHNYLAGLREDKSTNVSLQTSNFYLQAFKQFCRWLHRDRRAGESPVHHLHGLNVRTDRRHDRRALSVEELTWLLDTAENGPVRGGVSGTERSLLYRFAAETGLRAGEIRSLTASAFSLDAKPPTVTVSASYSKHRRADTQILKSDTAALLKQHLHRKLPSAAALHMPPRKRLATVLKQDLLDARNRWLATESDSMTREKMEATAFLLYKDGDDRYADFHALRHVTGSFLSAAGVSPKVAQAILRHSDIQLTMGTYTHSYREDEIEAVERLPDLSKRPEKTGDQRHSG